MPERGALLARMPGSGVPDPVKSNYSWTVTEKIRKEILERKEECGILNEKISGRKIMTREEFLSQLRLALQGKVSSEKVQENMDYYNDYIIEETRKGKSEAEVLGMLGDPGLLAKTIIAADDAGRHPQDTIYDSDNGTAYSSKRGSGTEGMPFGYSGGGRMHMLRMNNWWQKLLLILGVVMVILLIVTVVTGVARIFAPILPIIVIVFVMRVFGKRR